MRDTAGARLHVRWNLVRSTAESVLNTHHDGKLPVKVEKIARAMGIKVQPVEIADDELSGYFLRDAKTDEAIIGVNLNTSPARQRFTLAHELGHFLLHDTHDVGFDRKGYGYNYGRVMKRDADSKKGEKRDEVEANFFAAELLMPRNVLFERLVTGHAMDFLEEDFDATVSDLAKEFEVSVQALSIRLVQLKIIEAF